jgi:hypothetical protein
LIGDLEGCYGKIADGNELERVLDDIEDGGYGEFPAVWTEYVATEVTKGNEPEITGIKKRRFPVTC